MTEGYTTEGYRAQGELREIGERDIECMETP